eukprot:10773383-Prorocentrum_lima.AAC.1
MLNISHAALPQKIIGSPPMPQPVNGKHRVDPQSLRGLMPNPAELGIIVREHPLPGRLATHTSCLLYTSPSPRDSTSS